MARKIRARLILQQLAAGTSRNAIARSLGVSKHSIQAVAEAAEREKVSWQDAEGMEEGELYSRLFPEKADAAECVYPDPDWDAIHRELRKTGVTLRLLHGEYADALKAEGKPWMSYDRFCKRYAEYAERRNVVSRVGHKAGRTLEVDWAGPTMQLADPMSGEVSKVYLFVAALPFSRYSYVEPTLDMKQDTWLRCHVHAFAFFGGCTPIIVPDNLLTGVKKHPKEGEVVPSEAYRELAAHYGAAVLPARVRHPRDKPSAENEVWCATMYVIGALRGRAFTDMGELRAAVAECVERHNAAPFEKREGSRLESFMKEEADLLRPLPAVPYEVCEWVRGRKVQQNCHVSYRGNFYSAPFRAVGSTVDLRVTDTALEIWKGSERLSTHALMPPCARNRYSTHEEDMPDGKAWQEWDADRIRRWADRIGPDCRAVAERIFQSYAFEEQAFNACLAVLRLSRRHGSARLERACGMALASGRRSPRYRDIEPILKSGQDSAAAQQPVHEEGGCLRGEAWYGRDDAR